MSTFRDSFKFQQYSKISIGREVYTKDEAVIINGLNGLELAIINDIYDSNDELLLNIRKYIFASNLKKLFKKQGIRYDEENEVVQDLSQTYDIPLKHIIKKCTIAFLCTDDNVYYIRTNNLNPSNCFSCRFSVKGNQLFPLTDIITKNLLSTPKTKLENTTTNNMDKEITPVTAAVNNNIEICFENEYFSPTHRNQVKRNLNRSFGNSPHSKEKSILNYSIESLSDEEDQDRLVVKLKVSRNKGTRSPKKRNALNTDSGVSSPPKIRKSNRSICRKSYADYVSPQKTTPNKRIIGYAVISDDEDYELDSRKNKAPKNTPKKVENLKNSTSKYSSSSKTESRTPLYAEELNSMYRRTPRGTPARRSLTLTKAQENNSPTRSIRSCRKTISSYQEESLGVLGVLSDNLDDSLRTNVLKNTFKNLELDENDKNLINTASNDSETEGEEIKTVKHDVNTRAMRISLERLDLSNRSGKNDSDSSGSDCSSDGESTPKKRKQVKVSSKVHTPRSSKKPPKTTTQTTKSSRTNKTSPKNQKQTPTGTPKTPRNRAKLIREGVVTPSMQERSKKIKGDSTPLMKARSQLHVSYVPEALPCREKEYCDIYNFVEDKLLDGCGGCMYISGVPGTGKTATVTSVIKHLQESKAIPKFTFININGMRLTEPKQSYVEILKQLKGKTVSWEEAQNTLEETFVKVKKMEPVVMLIDELDILCTKRQDVVYNLLDWPTKAKNQLVVISIANTMDLPERLLMNRVTSRLGLTRLTFQAYTFKQLQEIVTKRLCGTDSFNPDAIQFVARKVASVSGDARRALDICRRAAEIAESEGKTQLVNMNHVNEALNAMITQPKVLAIKSCSRLEQLILQSIVAEVERTGVEETTFCDVYKMLITCTAIEGFKIVSSTIAQSAVTRLGACRLILAEQKCNNIYQKIILNVSIDDVYYALQKNRS